jgi:hypothetical protein
MGEGRGSKIGGEGKRKEKKGRMEGWDGKGDIEGVG